MDHTTVGHSRFLVRYWMWKDCKTGMKKFIDTDDSWAFAEVCTFARHKAKEGFYITIEEFYDSPYKELIYEVHRELHTTNAGR